MTRLELHIRRRRAAPDRCPECGLEPYKPKDASTGELLKCLYASPSWTEVRPVPGWYGFKTWYFVCTHMESGIIAEQTYASSFLSKLPKTEWTGGTWQIPIPFRK